MKNMIIVNHLGPIYFLYSETTIQHTLRTTHFNYLLPTKNKQQLTDVTMVTVHNIGRLGHWYKRHYLS